MSLIYRFLFGFLLLSVLTPTNSYSTQNSADLLQEIKPGDIISIDRKKAFQILEPLGQGGYNMAFRAKSFLRNTPDIVVIKLLKKSTQTNETSSVSNDSFIDDESDISIEDIILKTHKHFYSILRTDRLDTLTMVYGTSDAVLHLTQDKSSQKVNLIIMEYVDGQNLFNLLPHWNFGNLNESNQDNALLIQRNLDIFIQILEAIIWLHNSSMSHRDLTPRNIMISKDAQTVKIIDYDLVGIKNSFGISASTPGYLDPGTANRFIQSSALDAFETVHDMKLELHRDFYSLAMIIYEFFFNEILMEHFLNSKGKRLNIPNSIATLIHPAHVDQMHSDSQKRIKARITEIDEKKESLNLNKEHIESLLLMLRSFNLATKGDSSKELSKQLSGILNEARILKDRITPNENEIKSTKSATNRRLRLTKKYKPLESSGSISTSISCQSDLETVPIAKF